MEEIVRGVLLSGARELKQLRDEGRQVEAPGRGPVARQSHAPGRDSKVLKPLK